MLFLLTFISFYLFYIQRYQRANGLICTMQCRLSTTGLLNYFKFSASLLYYDFVLTVRLFTTYVIYIIEGCVLGTWFKQTCNFVTFTKALSYYAFCYSICISVLFNLRKFNNFL